MVKPLAGKKPATPRKKTTTKPAATKKAAGKSAPARKKAAPPQYDREKAIAAVLEELASGASLIATCKRDGFPSFTTFMRWLAEEGEKGDLLRDQYARAREAQADRMADEILQIADDGRNDTYVDDEGQVKVDHDVIARSRLRVDARKWLASKMAPKKYGDKLVAEHTGANGGAIQVASTVTFVRAAPRPEGEE